MNQIKPFLSLLPRVTSRLVTPATRAQRLTRQHAVSTWSTRDCVTHSVRRHVHSTTDDRQTTADDRPPAMDDSARECERLREENKRLEALVRDTDDKYKRALAETENTRVRFGRQVEEARALGIQSFCKDLLEVADVLQMALQSVAKDEAKKDKALSDLYSGLEMTEKQLQTVFRRHGLSLVNPLGLKFDPNSHHALFTVEDAEKEPGTVAVVHKLGYKLHERVVRPAMVGVVSNRQ